MDVTRSQLTAKTGIPVCLVRGIWQFKVFTGKEVTPLHEEGNSLQFRAGKKATHFHYKWLIDIWQTNKTERKERSQFEIVNWKYVSQCDEQMKNRCLIRPRGDVRNTIGTEWRRLRHIKFFLYLCEMTTKCNISWDCRSTLFGKLLTGFWVYFMWRLILSQ